MQLPQQTLDQTSLGNMKYTKCRDWFRIRELLVGVVYLAWTHTGIEVGNVPT